MYSELSKFRQQMNQTTHIEPTGDKVFNELPADATGDSLLQ